MHLPSHTGHLYELWRGCQAEETWKRTIVFQVGGLYGTRMYSCCTKLRRLANDGKLRSIFCAGHPALCQLAAVRASQWKTVRGKAVERCCRDPQ